MKAGDYDHGWKHWDDMVRYYPSAVHRRRLILDWTRGLRPRTVLDVGCGRGHLISKLAHELPEAELTGVDQATYAIVVDRRHFPRCRFEKLDICRARLRGKYDLVVCSEVIEHVDDVPGALDNLVAMTGSHLLITVPTGTLYPVERSFGHLRHFKLPGLVKELTDRGLVIERAQAWGFPWMTLFKAAVNVRPEATVEAFGSSEWSWPKKALGAALTGLFYLNVPGLGPQLFILARVRAEKA